MGYRNLVVSSPSKLSVKNQQLIIENGMENSVPIEDINSVMIENQSTNMTMYALEKCASNNVAVYICDEKHLPSALVLPLNGYYHKLKSLNLQLSVPKPLIKRLWQQIIRCKIENQALCLSLQGFDSVKRLNELKFKVTSGDKDNIEAVAANFYFKQLFGNDFKRSSENCINAGLNYGYAILRGLVARSIVAHGLEPCLGLFHSNQLNAFNLADDLLEPFRAIVDLYVSQNIKMFSTENFEREHKLGLYNLINYSIISDGEKHSVPYAIERMVMGLIKCYKGDKERLILPKLIPLKIHSYE